MPENDSSQEQLIALLETTVQQLEGVVQKLKTVSPERLPTKTTLEALVKTTQAIAADLEPASIRAVTSPSSPTVPEASPIAEVSPTSPSEEIKVKSDESTESDDSELSEPEMEIDSDSSGVTEEQSWWNGIIRGIRLILPSSWSDNLSNWAITGIIVGILVVILSTSVFLFIQPLTLIAESPSVTSKPKVVPTPPLLESPEIPQPVKNLPPPEPELTPEQNLIGAIQQEVIDLTSQYPEGLIGSIEANFGASRLMVTLGEQWYELTPTKQDTLANSIFKRSQRLDFRKIEITDSQGNLIARSPVVGNEIIIIRR